MRYIYMCVCVCTHKHTHKHVYVLFVCAYFYVNIVFTSHNLVLKIYIISCQ